MDFALTSCPYCGRSVDPSDPTRYVCQSCGKYIYRDRTDAQAFIRPGEIEDRFRDAFAAVADGNEKKAMDIANDLVESTGCCDHDSFFLRGYINAIIGEDGKSLADWKKGLELLSNDTNLDAYVVMMARSIASMIIYKEREFIEFNVVGHIDRLCEEIDANTGMSCKAFVYYTILFNCIDLSRDMDEEDRKILKDILPNIFRRIVAYQRNYWSLPKIIDQYLRLVGYDPETYEDDDNEVPHIYDLLRSEFARHTSRMTEEDRVRIFDRWDDASLRENIEPLLDSMVGPKRGGLLAILRAKKEEPEADDLDRLIHSYVDKCLLIDGPVEEPAELRALRGSRGAQAVSSGPSGRE